MFENARFNSAGFGQAKCVSNAPTGVMVNTKRPGPCLGTYVHRAWRAGSPAQEGLTG